MEQSSTAKIVSLHMEHCIADCPNSDVCYHRRKEIAYKHIDGLPANFRMIMLGRGYIIYESICQPLNRVTIATLSISKNYNITLPYTLFEREPALRNFKKQVQITVHTAEQARKVLDYQKLFLLKDDQTFNYALSKGLFNIPYSYMHFCIDQDWITKEKLQELMYYRMLSNTIGTTLDSCAESWIINGRCPYRHKNYIDITFDGTLRTCPFNRKGIPIIEVSDGDYDSLFNVDCQPEQCTYSKFFMER